jgi:hypothetical protein
VCSAVQVGGDVKRDVICRPSASTGKRPTQVPKGLSMGEGRRLLKVMRCGVLSSLSFTDNSRVRQFDQAWLRKASDIVEGKRRGNVN